MTIYDLMVAERGHEPGVFDDEQPESSVIEIPQAAIVTSAERRNRHRRAAA